MEIERYIPEGREHAISRKEMRALLGRDDRVIREWIKRANRRLEPEGKVILSSSSWRGYWISSGRRSALYCGEMAWAQYSSPVVGSEQAAPLKVISGALRGKSLNRLHAILRLRPVATV